MSSASAQTRLKQPKNLSPRIQWLRDYYFKGADRKWNNEYTSWTTGTPWDAQFNEMSFYIVPETYTLMQTMYQSFRMSAYTVTIPNDFFSWSIPERRAWFNKEVMVNYLPHEILPGDLLAGARFNIQTSMCLSKKEMKKRTKLVMGKNGVRNKMKWFHDHGFGNSGAVSGHLIPDYATILAIGFKGVYKKIESVYNQLSNKEKKGAKGANLRAMMTAATMPRDLALQYAKTCTMLANEESDQIRKEELIIMARNLEKVPWEGATTFWEAVQSLWLTHMLVMSDENYPGPGVSFGRIDQYLYPYWRYSLSQGMDREFGKEILKCFFVHSNTAYDAMIRTGNNGITSGYGQLITLAGVGKDGSDMANDLTYALLEVIDEMSPMLEPKPNIRLHRKSPDELLDKVVDMIASCQGAPFLLNFDERSMAGMLREAKKAGIGHLINENNVHEYAPVGCLENTMVGNDRSGTVDNNLNLAKAVELALNNGKDFFPFTDPVTGKTEPIKQIGPKTKDPRSFKTFDEFWNAYEKQTKFIINKIVELYEESERIRAMYHPTPYLSCLVKGCAEQGKDITQGGAEINFTTLEAVTYATTVDSLLAIKYMVYDKKLCTMEELIKALKANWEGYEYLQTIAKNRAPKYGRDDDKADELGLKVMKLWTQETWKYKTKSTGRQFRPGMLSWNYWVGDGYILPATPDGRKKGQFLSNALCPVNGADINGPTSNTNSVGKVLGGKANPGDYLEYVNLLPNGASHTITFNPSLLKDPEHRNKFRAFLRAYAINGGTALQINMLDPDMLRDAQKHPQDYRHLLVRVTGYNAYFVSIGKELQDEVIARVSHNRF
ncbi:MAG: pyruvate formate lyase family protein [Spirochaetota bacterium]